MAQLYYQDDCHLEFLKGKTIAVIGYGSQGHAHALNLHESGIKVVVGLYNGSKSWKIAENAGLKVMTAADAAKAADVIMILINDEEVLRDLLMLSDKYRDPQPYVLAYDNAYRVGEAIAANGNDPYLRAKAAAETCCAIVQEGIDGGKLILTKFETNALNKIKTDLAALPAESSKFIEQCMEKYTKEVAVFKPENYSL